MLRLADAALYFAETDTLFLGLKACGVVEVDKENLSLAVGFNVTC